MNCILCESFDDIHDFLTKVTSCRMCEELQQQNYIYVCTKCDRNVDGLPLNKKFEYFDYVRSIHNRKIHHSIDLI